MVTGADTLGLQVRLEESTPVELFASGEYHAIVVQEADRWKLMNIGFTLRALPNSDDLAYLPESDVSADGLAARFKPDANGPLERYGSQGRTSKGLFSNVLGVTDDGKVVLDNGSGTEIVELGEILPVRPLSLNGEGAFVSR